MAERKSTVLLAHHLKQLKLPTFQRDYAAVAATCGRENQPFETFLLRLCERELLERQQRATERRIKAAKFPTLKTIESFRFDAQPSINETLVRELLAGEFIDRRENVLLIGNSGNHRTNWSCLSLSGIRMGKDSSRSVSSLRVPWPAVETFAWSLDWSAFIAAKR